MRFEKADSGLLRPIQAISSARLNDLLKAFNPALLQPVPVVEICEEEQRYILGDGHHRSTLYYFRREEVPLAVLETDEDIRRYPHGAFHNSHFLGRDDFLSYYEANWRFLVTDYGWRNLPDAVRGSFPDPCLLGDLQEKARKLDMGLRNET